MTATSSYELDQSQPTVYTTVRPMTRHERAVEAFWESMRWLRCHVLRRHFPVTEYRDRRVQDRILFEATGRRICDVCGRLAP